MLINSITHVQKNGGGESFNLKKSLDTKSKSSKTNIIVFLKGLLTAWAQSFDYLSGNNNKVRTRCATNLAYLYAYMHNVNQPNLLMEQPHSNTSVIQLLCDK